MTAPEFEQAAVVALLAYPAAFLAHESTHALATYAVGGRVTGVRILTVRSLPSVTSALPPGAPVWRERLIGLAPTLVGVGVGVVVLASGWRPYYPVDGVLVLAWLWPYTIGGPGDYSLKAKRGGRWWGQRVRERWDDLSDGRQQFAIIYSLLCLYVLAMASSRLTPQWALPLHSLGGVGILAAAAVEVGRGFAMHYRDADADPPDSTSASPTE